VCVCVCVCVCGRGGGRGDAEETIKARKKRMRVSNGGQLGVHGKRSICRSDLMRALTRMII